MIKEVKFFPASHQIDAYTVGTEFIGNGGKMVTVESISMGYHKDEVSINFSDGQQLTFVNVPYSLCSYPNEKEKT